MKRKDLRGWWEVNYTYIDPETKFFLTETEMHEGSFTEAFESTLFNIDSQDIRIRYRGKEAPSG